MTCTCRSVFGLLAALFASATPAAASEMPASISSVSGKFPHSIPRRTIRLREVSPLQFGTFTIGKGGGSLTIDPRTGSRTASGNVAPLGGGYDRGLFEISGEPGGSFSILMPNEMPMLNRSGRPGILAMRKLASHPPESGMLGPDGKASVGVGAMLQTVGGKASAGEYTGVFPITIIYNY